VFGFPASLGRIYSGAKIGKSFYSRMAIAKWRDDSKALVAWPLVHALIVDDHLDSLSLISAFLEFHGYRATVAENGQIALRLALIEPPGVIAGCVGRPECRRNAPKR
jgi:hypothetical protein